MFNKTTVEKVQQNDGRKVQQNDDGHYVQQNDAGKDSTK